MEQIYLQNVLKKEKKSCRKQQEAGDKRWGLLGRDSPLKNVAKGVKTTPFYLTFAKIQA